MLPAVFLVTTLLFAQPALDSDECAVWHRELSFAQSVDHHDAKAFASHLHPGAVFSAGTENPKRGADAVLKAWAGLIEWKPVRLRWRPGTVNIGGNRNVAISRGPYVIEDSGPHSKARYSVGEFTTIWARESTTAPWLIIFDGGGPGATPVADLAAAEKFMAQSPAICPAR